MLQTGKPFLRELSKRAYADGRLQLIETVLIAIIAGGLLGMQITSDEWGPTLAATRATAWTAGLCGVAWLALGAALMHFSREAQRAYITSVFEETGLLYLALEHEPAEMLTTLRRRENWTRFSISSTAPLSFKSRMLALLQTYPANARALGFKPYAPLWRWTELALSAAGMGCGVLLVVQLYASFALVVSTGELFYPTSLRLLGALLIALVLGLFTIQHARKCGLWLALVDVLYGNVEREQATLARR